MPTLRVLLADDHPIVREGLKALLQAEPDICLVGDASDGETAVREALRLKPDVVVMDISMPGLSGTDATQRLKKAMPDVKIVALTAHEDTGYAKQMLEVG